MVGHEFEIEGNFAWHLVQRSIQQGELQGRKELYAASEIDLLQWVPWWCSTRSSKVPKKLLETVTMTWLVIVFTVEPCWFYLWSIVFLCSKCQWYICRDDYDADRNPSIFFRSRCTEADVQMTVSDLRSGLKWAWEEISQRWVLPVVAQTFQTGAFATIHCCMKMCENCK